MRPRFALFLAACLFLFTAATVKADDPPSAKVTALHLYNPPEHIGARLGGSEGGKAFGSYVNEIARVTGEFVADYPQPRPKGIFIGVGIKPNKEVRFWCESIEGEIPADKIKELEAKLAELPAISVHKGPVSFGLSISVFGQKQSAQAYPASWEKAAQASGKKVSLNPDELFKLIWPDATAATDDK